MSEHSLSLVFDRRRQRQHKARQDNLSAGLDHAIRILHRFLSDNDVDGALSYLERRVDIQTMAAHLSTFPDHLQEKADILIGSYDALLDGSMMLSDIHTRLAHVLDEGGNDGLAPVYF